MRILTFDIEDWYHLLEHDSTRTAAQWVHFEPRVRQNTAAILNLLARHDQRATFFVMGWIAEQNPGLVAEIASAGHDIGLHSYGHQLIWQQSPNEFRVDIRKNNDIIEQQLGAKVDKYRAPGFSVRRNSLWALEILAEAGITTDASIFPAVRAHGGMPAFPDNFPCLIKNKGNTLKEFPVSFNTIAGIRGVVTGGGYFRFWPYTVIRHFTERSPYVMSYFHPRDFDIRQPVLSDLGPYRRFRAYFGLKNTAAKLERWITEFSFTDLQTASEAIDWNKTPVVEL